MHVSIIILNNHNLSIDHNINIFVIIQHNLNTSVTRKDLCMSFFIQKYAHFMFLQWCSHCTHTVNQSGRNRDASLILGCSDESGLYRWRVFCASLSVCSVCADFPAVFGGESLLFVYNVIKSGLFQLISSQNMKPCCALSLDRCSDITTVFIHNYIIITHSFTY